MSGENELKITITAATGAATAAVDAFDAKVSDTTSSITSAFKSSSRSVDADVQSMSDGIQKLLNRYDPLGTKLRSLQADFTALNKAASSGQIGSGHDAAVDNAYKGLNEEIAKTKLLMTAAGVAGVEGFEKAAVAAEKSAFSTAGAKRELMVLGHEAMSGNFSRMPGSFMVLAERMDLTTMLMSPMTLGLIGIGIGAAAMAVEIYKGYEELDQFNKALVLTGGYAGMTRSAIDSAAESIGTSLNGGSTKAREALEALSATGKFTAATMSSVALVVEDYRKLTGASADEAVKQFAGMAGATVEWARKSNDQYHALTVSQLEHIEALVKQGEKEEAIIVISEALHRSFRTSNEEIGILKMSYLGWGKILDSVADSLKHIGQGNSAAENVTESIAKENDLRKRLAQQKELPFSSAVNTIEADLKAQHAKTIAFIKVANDETNVAYQKGENARIQQEALAGSKILEDIKQHSKTKEELIADSTKKIADAAKAANAGYLAEGKAAKYSDDDILQLQQEAAAKIRGKVPKDKSASQIEKSQLAFDIDEIRKQSEALTSVYVNSEKIMEAAHAAGLISDKEYYQAKSGFIQLLAAAQEDELAKEIARLQQEDLVGKGKIDNARKILDAEAKLLKVRNSAAAAEVVNGEQSLAAANRTAAAYVNAKNAADDYLKTVQRQNDREIDGIGKGTSYRTEQGVQNKIEDKYTVSKSTLDAELRTHKITQEDYDQYLAIAKNTYDEEVRLHAESRDAILAKEGDWLNGATEALANYADASRNVSQQSEKAFTSAFTGIEDALVTFASTGKLSFSNLATSIVADLARIQIKAAMSSVTAGIAGLFSSTASGTGAGTAAVGSLWGAQVAHSGGIVGAMEGSGSRSVDSSLFHGAPRFHTGGIASDEIPAILQKGEGVFTTGQMKALGASAGTSGSSNPAVTVIINNTASGTQATQSERTDSSGGKIIDVLIEQVESSMGTRIAQGSGLAPVLEKQYGLNRAAGAWR